MSSDNLARKIYLSGRFYVWVGHGNSTPLTKQNKQTISDSSETPISKFCNLPATILFPIRKSNPRSKLPTVRKRFDSKYFLGDLRRLFFLVTGNRYRKFQYYSRIYVRNWFTLLNQQNPLLDFEGTRFVNELWKKKKKNPPTYRPIGEMEGRVRETNIFLRVAPLEKQLIVRSYLFWLIFELVPDKLANIIVKAQYLVTILYRVNITDLGGNQ